MKIIKRNGEEVDYEDSKIFTAISKASKEVPPTVSIPENVINEITENIRKSAEETHQVLNVENIQDMVEKEIMTHGYFDVAKHYITYRYEHALRRKANSTDAQIISLLNRKNEDINEENSNKNPILISTQRDYMAGEVSKDFCRRFIFDEDLMKAHDEGMIHIHDMDYAGQLGITNCCLVNLEDMLQNGTVISGTKIDKPHSFATACNIATQAFSQISSAQFGKIAITER